MRIKVVYMGCNSNFEDEIFRCSSLYYIENMTYELNIVDKITEFMFVHNIMFVKN